MDPDLTLMKAKRSVCWQKAIHGQQEILNKPEEEIPIQTFSSQKPVRQPGNNQSQRPTQQSQPVNWGQKCSYCGKGPHPKQSYPSRKVTCHKCSKKGHYSPVCCSKAVAMVSEVQENSSFLDTIHETAGTSWIAPIKIDGQEIVFKLDTGAEATAMSTKTFETLKNIKLQESTKILCGPNNKH